MTRYPNLLELRKYHPYGEPAMCDHAMVEPELLHAVLEDGGLLEPAEIRGLARLYGIPRGVIECDKAIMLDMGRRRHMRMVAEVDNLYIQLKCMARDGNKEAEKYLEFADWRQQRFMRAAHVNKLSYGHYLAAKEILSNYVSWSMPKPKRRGIRTMKGGAVWQSVNCMYPVFL